MVKFTGYNRPLKRKVEFEVEEIISIPTSRGMKWHVRGNYEGNNMSAFTSEAMAKELSSQLKAPPSIYEMEELAPVHIFHEAEEESEIIEETSANELPSKYLKKDGTPDMRYKVAREWASQNEDTGIEEKETLDAEYVPGHELSEYEPEDLTHSSVVEGDINTDALRFSRAEWYEVETPDICFKEHIPPQIWNSLAAEEKRTYMSTKDESLLACPNCEVSKQDLRNNIDANADCPSCVFSGDDFAPMWWAAEEPPSTSSQYYEESGLIPFMGATKVIPNDVYHSIMLHLPETVYACETEDGLSYTLSYHQQNAPLVDALIETHGLPPDEAFIEHDAEEFAAPPGGWYIRQRLEQAKRREAGKMENWYKFSTYLGMLNPDAPNENAWWFANWEDARSFWRNMGGNLNRGYLPKSMRHEGREGFVVIIDGDYIPDVYDAEFESDGELPQGWAEDLSNYRAEEFTTYDTEEFIGEGEKMTVSQYYSNLFDFKDSDEVYTTFNGDVVVVPSDGESFDAEDCYICGKQDEKLVLFGKKGFEQSICISCKEWHYPEEEYGAEEDYTLTNYSDYDSLWDNTHAYLISVGNSKPEADELMERYETFVESGYENKESPYTIGISITENERVDNEAESFGAEEFFRCKNCDYNVELEVEAVFEDGLCSSCLVKEGFQKEYGTHGKWMKDGMYAKKIKGATYEDYGAESFEAEPYRARPPTDTHIVKYKTERQKEWYIRTFPNEEEAIEFQRYADERGYTTKIVVKDSESYNAHDCYVCGAEGIDTESFGGQNVCSSCTNWKYEAEVIDATQKIKCVKCNKPATYIWNERGVDMNLCEKCYVMHYYYAEEEEEFDAISDDYRVSLRRGNPLSRHYIPSDKTEEEEEDEEEDTSWEDVEWSEDEDEEEEDVYDDVEWLSEGVSTPKPATIATLVGLGALAAYLAPHQIRGFFKNLSK